MSSSTSLTLRPFVVALALGFALLLAAPSAFAQGKAEGPAKALQKKAMEEDYLMTDFAKAKEKLDKAIAQCGENNCSPALRSRLHRDLGVVLIGGGIDKEKGIASMAEAIKLDPTVQLEPDIKTKDLEQAFAEAKKRATAGGGTAAPSAPTGGGGQPEGDFVHTPVAEQQIRTPIPVYVEYGGEEPLVRVIVRYKGFGMTDWKTTELKKMGDKGWGGLLPCADVLQGTTQYYVQGFDANNDPIAVGGDRNNPYRVPITREPVAEPPHLPDASPPTQCADTGDCPPNFPGCKKASPSPSGPEQEAEPTGKEGGEFCEEDSECKSNHCEDAKCTEYQGKKKGPKFWVGVAGALDFTMVPSSQDVCKLNDQTFPVNDQNYYCVRGDGSDYPSRDSKVGKVQNEAIVAGNEKSDRVDGGGALGNIRLMLTFDYAAHPNILIGGRLGLVLNTYPGEAAAQDGNRFAAPIHLEARVTYLFGKDPLTKKGFAPFVFGGAGIGQFETKVGVTTHEAKVDNACIEGADPIQNNPSLCRREVSAWHIAGPAFLTLGGGARYALTPTFALMAGLRLNLAFMNSFAPSFGPEIGAQFGF